MATRVNVTSIEAIEIFRSSLIVYLGKARPALEEVNAELTRMRVWVESTQKTHWTNQHKRCARQLEEAKAALFTARVSSVLEVEALQMAVTKAKRAMDQAEEKLRMVKK